MKKLLSILLAGCFIALALNMLGCGPKDAPGASAQNTDPIEEPGASAQNTDPIEEPGGTVGMPEQIAFRSMEAYREFAGSVGLDEAAFREFISANSYSVNGVGSKEDVRHALETIDAMPFPVVNGFRFNFAELCYEHDSFYVLYRTDEAEARYLAFDMRLAQSENDAEAAAKALDLETVVIPVENAPEVDFLLRAKDEAAAQSDGTWYYFTVIGSHRVRLITNLTEAELIDTLRGCRYTTMESFAGEER